MRSQPVNEVGHIERRQSFLRKVVPKDTQNSQKSDIKSLAYKHKIRSRRKVFKYFPVYYSNDLVHGSWWFVVGSFLSMLIAVVPLFRNKIAFMREHPDTLSSFNYSITWILLIISGAFFTLGSLAFVRATEEEARPPLLKFTVGCCGHCATDELLAAWCFLIAVLPAAPYAIIFLITEPLNLTYWGMVILAFLFIFCTYLFVLACYPSEDKKEFAMLKACCHGIGCKSSRFVNTHLVNDWLVGTWFFLAVTALALAACIYKLIESIHYNNGFEIYIWLTGAVDTLLFLVGSFYFVMGSYPHESDDTELQLQNEERFHQESPLSHPNGNKKTTTKNLSNAAERNGISNNDEKKSDDVVQRHDSLTPMTV